ncbi:MAG: hypothetical protein ABSF15_20295 [Candidatus Sulfotelmatobacter sp.]|jgi:hypothetical protein
MRTNTEDLTLPNKTTEQILSELEGVETILMFETFGSDHKARYNLMDEKSKLLQELKRRGWSPGKNRQNHKVVGGRAEGGGFGLARRVAQAAVPRTQDSPVGIQETSAVIMVVVRMPGTRSTAERECGTGASRTLH